MWSLQIQPNRHSIPGPPLRRTGTPTSSSYTASRNAARRVHDKRCERVVGAQYALDELRRDDLRARGARVRVVVREERVDGGEPEPLELVRDVLPVIDVLRADRLRRGLRVSHEAVRRVYKRAALPWVVRRLRGEDDIRALGHERLAGLHLVEDEGVDGLARRGRDARLRAVAEAVCAPIVGRAERAAVVVPELDHDDISRLDDVHDRLEAALVRERARGAAADSVVDDGRVLEGLLEVLAPP